MKFCYHLIESWPDLAWIADCRQGGESIDVFHGAGVVTTDDWFCEAVWDGAFEDGHFDRTDLVFGSGCRKRDQYIEFVSSGSTVDRLQTLVAADRTCVSNSLVCLISYSNARLKSADFDYFSWFGSITRGLGHYDRTLPTTEGDVSVLYFNNIRWDGHVLAEIPKPMIVRDFGSFESYRNFLSRSLEAIAVNMRAGARHRKFDWLGTLSTGYDSTTISTLARGAGLEDVITFVNGRGGSDDSGEMTGKCLGLKTIPLDRNGWRSTSFTEVPFLAADAKGEDVFLCQAGDLLKNRVLLTGIHGDAVWNKNMKDTSPNIVRSDRSGLSLTEFRLWGTFLHLPVPFMGARQAADICRISNLEEMAPWDIGGKYNRPICRRIAEEAGIPRSYFGIKKKVASVLFDAHADAEVLSIGSFEDCMNFSQGNWVSALRRGNIPLQIQLRVGKLALYVRGKLRFLEKLYRALRGRSSGSYPKANANWLDRRLSLIFRRRSIYHYAFPWALERGRERYRRRLDVNPPQ